MEERFPSWFPILSVAVFSGALGWWLGRREGQLSARVAGLEAPRRRVLRARTGEDQYTYNPPSNEGEGWTTDAGISASEDQGQDPGGTTMDGGMTLSADSSKDSEGSASTDKVTLGPDKSSEGSATAAPRKPRAPSPMREVSRAVVENAPAPKMRAVTTETAESKPVPSAPPEDMRAASEYSMPSASSPRLVAMPSANRPVIRAEIVSDARHSSAPVARRR